MITKTELEQKYKNISTVELLEIISKSHDYTELAKEVAIEEVKSRGLYEDDMQNFYVKQVLKKDNL